MPYIRTCQARSKYHIYARELQASAKVFTQWDKYKYLKGAKGDYIAGPYAVIRCKICIFTGLGNGSRQVWRTAVAENIFTSCKWPDQLIIKLLGAS